MLSATIATIFRSLGVVTTFLEQLIKVIIKAGHVATVNKVFPGTILRPRIIIITTTHHIIIDLTVYLDVPETLLARYKRKDAKHEYLVKYTAIPGAVVPFLARELANFLSRKLTFFRCQMVNK